MTEQLIRQATDGELQLLEMQRDAFIKEFDALVRKYAMCEDNLVAYLLFPGKTSAVVFTDLSPQDQVSALMAVLSGYMQAPQEMDG